MSSAYDAENIRCNDSSEYPIEHLFKCIYILESIPECTKELARLKKLADKYWSKIPVKKNVKTYESYILESSGICYHKKATYNKIILSGYENEYVEVTPRKDPIFVSCVKDYSLLWYVQLKAYQNKKATFGQHYEKKPNCNVVKYNNMLKAMELVTEEESKLISLSSGINIFKLHEEFYRFFKYNNYRRYSYGSKEKYTVNTYVLNNEELKDMDEFIEACRGCSKYDFEVRLREYVDKLKASFAEDRDLSLTMITDNCHSLNRDPSKGLDEYKTYFDKVYKELLKIEDPAVISILKEYNIVDENHEPIKVTEEEIVEDIIEVIISAEEVSEEVDNILEVEFTAI